MTHQKFRTHPRRALFAAAATLSLIAAPAAMAQPDGPSPTAARKASADSSMLNPNHPDRYVVKKGDTLWDIAGKFLRDPWYWPEIWQVNPQISNPHLIYPGDVLSLAYVNGHPVIRLERGQTVSTDRQRLEPHVRSKPLKRAVPTVPYETIRAFLSKPIVLSREQAESLPYVLAIREGLIASTGDEVYVRGLKNATAGQPYLIVHVGKPIVDPDDGDVVGYKAIFVGDGVLQSDGDPATLQLTSSKRETVVGDLLMKPQPHVTANFLPRAPGSKIDGQIISVLEGRSLVGQYQVVVINRGKRDGLERGDVLRAIKEGAVIRDHVRKNGLFADKVQLPDESAGIMLVFRVFDRICYALVMEATHPLAVHDTIRNP